MAVLGAGAGFRSSHWLYVELPRRATFAFDPDARNKLFTDDDGVRIYGGLPVCVDDLACDGAASRAALLGGAGDITVTTDIAGYPVEVPPYTDPLRTCPPTASP